jgi:hypothetical protein
VTEVERGAMLSPDGRYRYRLTRRWADGPHLAIIGLNPSTADGYVDDPTIRRCVGFAQAWGYGQLTVVNLFAWRARNPRELLRCPDPVGRDNDRVLRLVTDAADLVVDAWGAFPMAIERAATLERLGIRTDRFDLGRTAGGHPRHPLYLRADVEPRRSAALPA